MKEKTLKDIFKIVSALVIGFILTVLITSNNYKKWIKAERSIDSLKQVNKTFSDSLWRIQNDSTYKIFKIERTASIRFENCLNQFSIKQLDTIKYFCKEFDVPERMVFRLVYYESRFDSTAYSSEHAIGLFQITRIFWLHYDTEESLDFNNEYDRIWIAIWGLHCLYDEYGDWNKVLSVYNSGTPNNKVTNKYTNWILK